MFRCKYVQLQYRPLRCSVALVVVRNHRHLMSVDRPDRASVRRRLIRSPRTLSCISHWRQCAEVPRRNRRSLTDLPHLCTSAQMALRPDQKHNSPVKFSYLCIGNDKHHAFRIFLSAIRQRLTYSEAKDTWQNGTPLRDNGQVLRTKYGA